MKKETDFTDPENEQEHRFCPICDEEIQEGSPLHQCSKKKLKELEKRSVCLEEDSEVERSYGDKLQEYENHFDNDKYYDAEDDEE